MVNNEARITAKERYAECKTIDELKDKFGYDERSAETFEFLSACEKAYKKRYFELLDKKQTGGEA